MTETPLPDPDERVGVSLRMMDITVALLLLLVGAVVVYDSYRLGAKWGSDGPESGYFPFRVGLLICIASVATLVQAVRARNLTLRDVRQPGAPEARPDRADPRARLRLLRAVHRPVPRVRRLHRGVHGLAGQVFVAEEHRSSACW